MDSTERGRNPGRAPRPARWASAWALILASSVLVAAAAPAPVGPSVAAAIPGSPHAWTRSYYVANANPTAMARLGCLNSDTAGRITLFFGAPVVVDGGYGATLWGGSNQTVAQVGELMKDFVRGYAWCRPDGRQALVAMGTSNSGLDTKADGWIAGHGHTWATVVRDVADWVDATFPGVAQVYGAWDAEPSWSAYPKADLWMQGYNGVPWNRAVHAHFSADGCPRDRADGGPCNNGWSQDGVWRLAWWYDPALPMPQIYANSGVNARQWQKIDEYGARHHGDGMVFSGVMAQHQACLQVGGCQGISNLPHEAHDQLLASLNGHPLTAQPSLETVTDIGWHVGNGTSLSTPDNGERSDDDSDDAGSQRGGATSAGTGTEPTGRNVASGADVLAAEIDALLAGGLAPGDPKVARLAEDLVRLQRPARPSTRSEPGMDMADILGTPPGRGARSVADAEHDTASAEVTWDRGPVDCEPLPAELLTVEELAAGAQCVVAPQPDGTSRYVAVSPDGTIRSVRFTAEGALTRLPDDHIGPWPDAPVDPVVTVTQIGDVVVSVARVLPPMPVDIP